MITKLISTRVRNSEQSSTVRIADKVKEMRENGEEVYDFSAGRAFEHTPEYVIETAVKAMKNGDTHQTPAKGTKAYREAVVIKLKRENDIIANPDTEIVATMGCKQGLTASLLAVLNPGDEVIVEDPCFVTYKQIITYLGGKPVTVPLHSENNFRWKREQLENAITPKTKAVIMCTPHNPTGVVHTKEDLEEVAAVAIKHNLVVITDEPYERTVWNNRKHYSLANIEGMRERTITLMSLTKSFSMGGWRIGFAYADPEIIAQMNKLQQHLITCVNSFVQAGAITALAGEPKDAVKKYWSDWEEKVHYFTSELNKINGLSCEMPEGGLYAWADISRLNIRSDEFADRLLEQENVAVIPGGSFGTFGENYIRVTCVKSYPEIEKGLTGIRNFVNSLV